MNIKKRMSDLEGKVGTGHACVPHKELIQVLRGGEAPEERRAALMEKYGTFHGALIIRIKGRDA